MITKPSSKLAALLRLCFTAGIVFSAGSAIADCSLDHTICTQPGPVHGGPGFCDLFPDNIACFDHGQTGGGGNTDDIASFWVPHTTSQQVSCASSLDQRRAAAAADIMAWWASMPDVDAWWIHNLPGGPYNTVGPGYVTISYSSGEAQVWNISNIDPAFGQAGYGTSVYVGSGAYGNVFISPITPWIATATGLPMEFCYHP